MIVGYGCWAMEDATSGVFQLAGSKLGAVMREHQATNAGTLSELAGLQGGEMPAHVARL